MGVSFDSDLSFGLIWWKMHDNEAKVMFMILWCNMMPYCNLWDYLWIAWGVSSFLAFSEGCWPFMLGISSLFLIPLFFCAPYHLGFGSGVILRALLSNASQLTHPASHYHFSGWGTSQRTEECRSGRRSQEGMRGPLRSSMSRINSSKYTIQCIAGLLMYKGNS